MAEPKVNRISSTRRFLDKSRNPWEYVDEELPTVPTRIFSRNKQGTILSSEDGLTIMGSKYFSGSHYDFGPGSFALRITRRSVYIGSVMPTRNTEIEWKLRHSRDGTVDMIPFFLGSRLANIRRGAWSAEARGAPMSPIYSFGPGTIWTYFQPRRGTARVYSSLEGVF